MDKNLRIVYMGTPDFAVEALRLLVEEGYNVAGVVTMPDKAVGRHHDVLQSSPAKQYAVSKGIPVLQPEKLKDEGFLQQLRDLKADVQVVVAFRMLPEVVWGMPPMGTFNLHAALLPQYRGAAPINWAVINGDKETGITTFFLDHDIDTGRIILQQRIPILETDNAGDVHDKLMVAGAQLVKETIDLIADGKATSVPQEQFITDEPLRPAPKIFRDTCRIQWEKWTVVQTHNFVRGLSPYPAAWTEVVLPDGKHAVLKIYRTSCPASTMPCGKPGEIVTDGKTCIQVALADGWLQLEEVQMAGKKRMPTADFLRGCHMDGCHME